MDSDQTARKDGFFSHQRRGYHHGRLKDALIEAARALLTERGPGGFTLAEAAKLVGVTGAAPYRHFADRAALIAELARRGFDLFAERMSAAWDRGQPDPATALGRMGSAYLAFAREEPGLYAAMFSESPPRRREPGSTAAGTRAFDQLVGATAATLVSRGGSPRDAGALALQIWAISHGVASLAAGGQLDAAACEGAGPERILQIGVRSLVEQAITPIAPTGPWGV